ncbi:hypothetical protein [Aestuariibius sp. HNIBRBA575]|uniref:hypothetical protein n=1 Tax=Aestuariibius sp. HNIBRBA575 TaxID=3233343 RepID=UPI0034A20072
MTDLPDLSGLLKPDETLIWQGAPTQTSKIKHGGAIFRIFGVVMLLCFLVVLLLGLNNLDEMDGAFGIWIGFLVISGTLAIVFRIVMPILGKRALMRTQYGVTKTRAVIAVGDIAHRYPVAKSSKIEVNPSRKHGVQVVFIRFRRRRVRTGPSETRIEGGGVRAFNFLSADDAQAAEKALKSIRGKAV